MHLYPPLNTGDILTVRSAHLPNAPFSNAVAFHAPPSYLPVEPNLPYIPYVPCVPYVPAEPEPPYVPYIPTEPAPEPPYIPVPLPPGDAPNPTSTPEAVIYEPEPWPMVPFLILTALVMAASLFGTWYLVKKL